MHILLNRLSLLAILPMILFGLAACHTPQGVYRALGEPVAHDLQHYSYGAADDLIADARRRINANTPILVGTLNDVDKLERSSTFGRLVSEQISARFAQRGFSVSELKMRNSVNIKRGIGDPNESGEYLLSRDVAAISQEHQASAAVTGTYAVAGKEIFVNLKLIDVASGKLLSATDYNIPLDSNVRSLVENDATAFYGTSIAY